MKEHVCLDFILLISKSLSKEIIAAQTPTSDETLLTLPYIQEAWTLNSGEVKKQNLT